MRVREIGILLYTLYVKNAWTGSYTVFLKYIQMVLDSDTTNFEIKITTEGTNLNSWLISIKTNVDVHENYNCEN